MELADVLDSKSCGSDTVPVRPRSPAPNLAQSAQYPLSINDNGYFLCPIKKHLLYAYNIKPQSQADAISVGIILFSCVLIII